MKAYRSSREEIVAKHDDVEIKQIGKIMKERGQDLAELIAIGSSGEDEVDKAGTTMTAAGIAEATQPDETKVVMAKEGSSTG